MQGVHDGPEDGDVRLAVECLVCGGIHVVDPRADYTLTEPREDNG